MSNESVRPLSIENFIYYLERDLSWLQGAGEDADHQWLRTRVDSMKKNLKGLKLELSMIQPKNEG